VTDRERRMADRMLLEDAAKAVGFHFHGHRTGDKYGLVYENCYCSTTGNAEDWFVWKPLTDDGDALRLAVKLGICFGPNLDGDTAVAFGEDGRNITEPHGSDPYAATRRAIVRAAAAMAGLTE